MLGSLAKWLRIYGFDTFYPDSATSDDDLLRIAHTDQRLLITRDKVLIARGKKQGLEVIDLRTTDLNEQLRQVLLRIPPSSQDLLTRCIVCNTILTPVKKTSVKEHVPPKVFATKDEFWYCAACKKYYWMGTHYENMLQKIQQLSEKNNG